ncbi:DUF1236 domain-containing protein [Bradyrhizobium sp. BR 10289]|uniref:DUF1236 domain-containing protein n=1 Tax=Bradyrhizobium sp. BR 10289 TaxID=2749993 RepID=UPI001C6496AE|nr:DUF1236 domain-containing protein [Bradyrhizobium sp. BR 10289]MBW7974384.1 DUF1236 domain-containing protein [Bradyrhizobium sp. BR 10289]
MNTRLFLTTTAALAIATSALAQSSPGSSTSTPTTSQQQNSTSAATPAAPSTTPSSSATTPSNSAQTSTPSSNSAQTQAPAPSGTNTSSTQTQPASSSPTQAQTNSPSSNQTQSANPPASNTNQAQSPTGSGSTNTAQQPNSQQNTASQSSNTNVNASVNINDQQRTRISSSISHLNVQPLTSVNFSLSVGTVVPRDVRIQPLPADVVEIVPQYRGYDFVLVKDEIVIVEPSSYKIVAVMPYSGRSTAAAPARSEPRKTTFSDRDREVIRKHAKARPVERERQTTGSTVRTEIRTGERVPEGVEIESFPDEVYRDAPSLREYRYIHRDSRTYIVEPQERRIIEEID